MPKRRWNIVVSKSFTNETSEFNQFIDSFVDADEVIIRNVSLQTANAGDVRFITTNLINEPILCNVQTNYGMDNTYYFTLYKPARNTFNFRIVDINLAPIANFTGTLIIHFEFIQTKKKD